MSSSSSASSSTIIWEHIQPLNVGDHWFMVIVAVNEFHNWQVFLVDDNASRICQIQTLQLGL
jgi:hypothetical protein